MKRESAPARSDLEHAILGTEGELLADALELCELSLLERHPLVLEDRTRVAHRRIEHAREELVPEVVVGGDVTAAPGVWCRGARPPGPAAAASARASAASAAG